MRFLGRGFGPTQGLGLHDLGAVLAAGTPTQEEIGKIASRYDFQVV